MKIKESFKKLWEFIRKDGWLHIALCALMVLCLTTIHCPMWAADIIVLLIGCGYELYQKLSKKGTPEWHDVICDIIGIGLSNLVVCLGLLVGRLL